MSFSMNGAGLAGPHSFRGALRPNQFGHGALAFARVGCAARARRDVNQEGRKSGFRKERGCFKGPLRSSSMAPDSMGAILVIVYEGGARDFAGLLSRTIACGGQSTV